MCCCSSTQMPSQLGCRSLATVRVRRLPPAKHHSSGSQAEARLNGAWPRLCQRRALMLAKATAGLASAAEGEPQRCAMAGPPG